MELLKKYVIQNRQSISELKKGIIHVIVEINLKYNIMWMPIMLIITKRNLNQRLIVWFIIYLKKL